MLKNELATELHTLGDLVHLQAQKAPHAKALTFNHESLTYQQLDRRSDSLANALLALGIKSKSRVAIVAKDSLKNYEILFACAKIQAVVVPINWRLAPLEVSFILNDAEVELLFIGSEFNNQIKSITKDLINIETFITFDIALNKNGERWLNYSQLSNQDSDISPEITADSNDVVVQLYTIGTTGRPEGVQLAHYSLMAIAKNWRSHNRTCIDWSEADKSLVTLLSFHIGGVWWAIFGLVSGAESIPIEKNKISFADEDLNEPISLSTSLENQQRSTTKSPELVSNLMQNVWVYEGNAYDLSNFTKKHPGGEFFIGRMKNRDITTIVNIIHRKPEKAQKILAKYALGRKATSDDIHPKNNAPPFLFKDDFDCWRDTPKFDTHKRSPLLDKVRSRLNEPHMLQFVERMDFLFNIVTVVLVFAYIGTQLLQLFTPIMPTYVFIPLMVALRISLSGAGHYLNHRPLVNWNKVFVHIFDINYVSMAFVVIDGHTLMHHPYTQSEVDVKRKVFTAMMELPRYYRVPLYTLHKLGHVLTGMFIRTFELCFYAIKYGVEDLYSNWRRASPHYLGMIGMRCLLCGEFILFCYQGEFLAWFAQFIITLWISTFMIVASHNFEEEDSISAPSEDEDWAIFQVNNSYDLTIIGNRYIDCFLSAGLSPHRVHHILPYQKSGFANIVSEKIVREEAEKFGVDWLSPRNFFRDRLPEMAKYYLLRPSRLAQEDNLNLWQEHIQPRALWNSLTYVYQGFKGIGSI